VVSGLALAVLFWAQTTFVLSSDLYDACKDVGQELDLNFRLRHPRDGGRYFPVHNRCNPTYDLVPDWVNPTLRGLAAVTAISLSGWVIARSRSRCS
jgi:hypothetical protein